MNGKVKVCGQWAVFYPLCLVGFFAFMVLAGDEDPMNPMPFGRWLLIKAIAGGVLALCVWVGKRLHRLGVLPEYIDSITEDEEDC